MGSHEELLNNAEGCARRRERCSALLLRALVWALQEVRASVLPRLLFEPPARAALVQSSLAAKRIAIYLSAFSVGLSIPHLSLFGNCGEPATHLARYVELASKLASVPSLLVAKIDATQNDVEGIDITGFPTVYLSAGSKIYNTASGTAGKRRHSLTQPADHAVVRLLRTSFEHFHVPIPLKAFSGAALMQVTNSIRY